MNPTGSPSTCETCGLPYMVDGSCDIHMDLPTDYGRGFHRFCLACWHGMKSGKDCVYLWLCCEGWIKFGPYEWLRFDDEKQAILGPDGAEIAWKTNSGWHMHEVGMRDMVFSNPTITTDPFHPHASYFSHPKVKYRRGMRMADWLNYLDGPYQAATKAICERFRSKFRCPHCAAPYRMRVSLPKDQDLSGFVPDMDLQQFLACWYGLLLVSQGLHKSFRNVHPDWEREVFCPLPVHEIGEGCVRVSPSHWLLRNIEIGPAAWDVFVAFFHERILTDMKRITGVKPAELMKAIYRDRRNRRREVIHWTEEKLFESFKL